MDSDTSYDSEQDMIKDYALVPNSYYYPWVPSPIKKTDESANRRLNSGQDPKKQFELLQSQLNDMQRRYADMRSENKSKKDEQNAARAEDIMRKKEEIRLLTAKLNTSQDTNSSIEALYATKIQAVFRGFIARKKLRNFLIQQQAAVIIQSAWRGFKVRKSLKHASHPLFSQFRGNQIDEVIYSLVDRVQQEAQSRHMLEEAVRFMWTEVQTLRGELNTIRNKNENRASVLIQTYWRAYSARKLYSLMKEHRELT